MYYEWHNKQLNKENSLFLTIFNYFRQILVAFKYFVQSDWLIIVQNLELPYNVKLKTPVVTDRVLRVLSGIRDAQSSVFCVVFCRPLFIILSFFRLAIALPALLRYMTSENPFGIYKLFLSVDLYTHHYTIPIIKFIPL